MPIPEPQLETWSHQGAIAQSRDTYAAVKRALEAADHFEIFLQGSYANDTNIFAESDVDVVILSSPNDYSRYHGDVMNALVRSFGTDVRPGRKAIKIAARGNRRSADVVVAASYNSGICFFDPSGGRMVNYPKQHSANCTAKHQSTGKWFKPMVRILKNLRGRMLESGLIRPRSAPSYFLEGLLYNVPDHKFGNSYSQTLLESLKWINNAKLEEFTCPHGQSKLIGAPGWPRVDGDDFLTAAWRLCA